MNSDDRVTDNFSYLSDLEHEVRPAALVPGVRAHRRRVLPLLQRDRHRPQREGLARQGPRAQQQGEGHQLFMSC